ncbi:MAG: cupin domain-containing protein [Bacteroidales bacterium]|nr:cupin domain-containing protein [Bacteroidales bacterium]
MKLILLSGGSGRRLWPLSNDVRSKQFLKVLPLPGGGTESMIQRVIRQIMESGIAPSDIIIATSASQRELIESQVATDVHTVIEPMRRDTFPAIALSAAYLRSEMNCPDDEIVAVLPCDQFVDMSYFGIIRKMAEIAESGAADIVLMGIEPKNPSSAFGYMLPENGNGRTVRVKEFVEKPDSERAMSIIRQGGLWNGGVFAFSLGYMMDKLGELGHGTDYMLILENYGQLPKISFDYEVVEKADRICAVPYYGEWSDLGSWDSLVKKTGRVSGHTVMSDCNGTSVINEQNIPVVCCGVDNVIVASSYDGILVTSASKTSNLKSIVENLVQCPMYEEYSWGEARRISYAEGDGGLDSLTRHLIIKDGCATGGHCHAKRSEIYTVIKGKGFVALDGKVMEVKTGDSITIPALCRHAIKAEGGLELIEVQFGHGLDEKDIQQADFVWE